MLSPGSSWPPRRAGLRSAPAGQSAPQQTPAAPCSSQESNASLKSAQALLPHMRAATAAHAADPQCKCRHACWPTVTHPPYPGPAYRKGTILLSLHTLPSKGMYSMKRTCRGQYAARNQDDHASDTRVGPLAPIMAAVRQQTRHASQRASHNATYRTHSRSAARGASTPQMREPRHRSPPA